MRALLIATKVPWPAVDGGRLLVLRTLAGLSALGHRVTLVAPRGSDADTREGLRRLREWCEPVLVDARPRPLPLALLVSRLRRVPLSIARHTLPGVRRTVAEIMARGPVDVVHAEQLQALAQVPPTDRAVVLRAQNVESDLWSAAASRGRGRFLLRREAATLGRFEGAAVRRCDATVALTLEDAGRLRELAGNGTDVAVARVPFPSQLPPATTPLDGAPPVVVLASGGWLPNEDSVRWLLDSVWPRIRTAVPGARLHLFGHGAAGAVDGVTVRPAPADSRDAYAPGAILVVPLRIASGVRMKILEAWARGIPVVATPTAVSGLEVEHGREALLGADPEELADAIRRLSREPELTAALVAAGREKLHRSHDPLKVSADLVGVYEAARRRLPTASAKARESAE